MPRSYSIFLQCLTYCFLIGVTYALDGKQVQTVRSHYEQRFSAVVSISRKSNNHLFENKHYCTGTLVRQKTILTAAHCLAGREPDDIEIIAGSLKLARGKKYYPESWTFFNAWNLQHGNRNLTKNDIAVIKLKGEGILGIHPAELFLMDTIDRDNRSLVITGWGESLRGNKINNLRKATLQMISNAECSERATSIRGSEFVVPPNFFCTRADPYVLVTRGDGGTPIFNRENKVVGISVGTCPKLEGYQFNDEEFLREHKMNTHLRLNFYADFILHA